MEAAREVLGDGLLTSEGEHHLRQRRLIQPIFQRERVEAYAPVVLRHADALTDRWRGQSVVDVHAEMAALTLAIVVSSLFGSDLEPGEAGAVGEAMSEVLGQYPRLFSPLLRLTQRLPLPANRRFAAAVARFDDVIARLIARRRAEGVDGDDLLSRLLRAQEQGRGMSARQVRDEAVTLFLAGHETTSNALSWAWLLLSRHPEAEARLHAEVDGVADRSVSALPWTGAVVAESVRLYPPAWAIGRRATAPHLADGWTIPAGSVAIVSPWLLHRDERWWPEPFAFRPERWLGDDGSRPKGAYLPFGAGPRMCVGESFARQEAVLVLATLARRWRVRVEPGQPAGLQAAITLRPRGGILARPLGRG